MRLEHLTTAEILRTQHPETDLERVLFDRVSQAIGLAESFEEEAREAVEALDDYDCQDCNVAANDIDELQDTEKALRKLLDEHDIDHSEI
jgi:hypothetical protein